MIIRSRSFTLYCGDASDNLDSQTYLKWGGEYLLSKPHFSRVQNELMLFDALFLRQTHSTIGAMVTHADRPDISFIKEGDFLITQDPHLGLGVMTADCMPIACYDERTHSIGIAHAGWRGLIGGVVPRMISAMIREYTVRPCDLEWWIGPSAKVCCYEVSEDFGKNIEVSDRQCVMISRDGKWFFDGITFLRRQLAKYGISDVSLHFQNAFCTICTLRFCSYRRSRVLGQSDTRRNMTMIALCE